MSCDTSEKNDVIKKERGGSGEGEFTVERKDRKKKEGRKKERKSKIKTKKEKWVVQKDNYYLRFYP